jgi:hypothetical protein
MDEVCPWLAQGGLLYRPFPFSEGSLELSREEIVSYDQNRTGLEGSVHALLRKFLRCKIGLS